MMTTPPRRKTLIILILGALTTVTPFSIDMYLPAFKQIAADFNTVPAKISLSVTSYFIGMAIGQLVYGPLLDRFGRKPPLYAGLLLYLLASIGCMQSQSVEVFIAFRSVQALGGCVAMVAALAMVRDFFPVEDTAKIFSLLMLILGLSPLLAPTAGGFVASSLNWHWIFIVLCIIVILIIAAVFFLLPNGYKPDKTLSLKIGPTSRVFLDILKNRAFLMYALAGAFSFATMFIYVAGSPVIFLEIFGIDPKVYGGIFAGLSVGFILSNQLNILLLRKFTSKQIFIAALTTQFILSIIFTVGCYFNWFDLTGTIVMFFLILSCLGLTYPNASALALSSFTKNVGSASAMVGFLQIGIAGILSGSVGLLVIHNSLPVAAMMAATALVALIIMRIGLRNQ